MTEVLRQSTSKKLVRLPQDLAQHERFNVTELGLEWLGMQILTAMLDNLQPHRITLKTMLSLESPNALTLRQYLCDISRPGMSHIIYSVFIRD